MSRIFCLLLIGAATSAFAQCTKDTDCKGERICSAGTCVAPNAPTGSAVVPPPPPPAYLSEPAAPPTAAPREDPYSPGWKSNRDVSQYSLDDKPKRRGWAGGAAVLGFIGSAAVLGFGLTSGVLAGVRQNGGAGVLLATTAVLLAVLGPIVAAGAGSSRIDESVMGSVGSRVMGWVFYALTLLTVIPGVLLITSNGNSNPGSAGGLIIGMSIGGCLSLIFFSIDAVSSANGARRFLDGDQPPAPRRKRRSDVPLVMPNIALAQGSSGALTPTLGLGGTF